MKKYLIFSLFVFILSLEKGYCETEAASFLKITPGARPTSMGEAFCAVSDDVNAGNFNPAGYSQLRDPELYFSHNEWLEGIQNEFLGYAKPINEKWAIGFSINYFNIKDIVERDAEGNETGKMFGGRNSAVSVSVSRILLNYLYFGTTFKMITEELYNKKDSAYASDIGLLADFYDFKIGFSVLNIGTQLTLDKTAFNLPKKFILGAAYYLEENILCSMDIDFLSDNKLYPKLGLEYVPFDLLALRTGYVLNRYENTGPGITAGIGFTFKDCTLDYAFSPHGDLGPTHKISLGVRP